MRAPIRPRTATANAVFWVQDADGHPYDVSRHERLKTMITRTLKGEVVAREALKDRDKIKKREREFHVQTSITFDNLGSEIYTIIEVDARDRPGLLYDLTRAMANNEVYVASAVIATYGEQAVDTFYAKDAFGLKFHSEARQKALEKKLREAIEAGVERADAIMKPIRLVSGFLTVSFWTLLSRVFGFVRDAMIAAYLGSGPVAEAFLVAFSLPNLFRRFFAEGAFNLAFVPMFSKRVESDDDPASIRRGCIQRHEIRPDHLHRDRTLAMPLLVWMMASGFVGDQRFDLAVTFGRIAFSYILFISLTALVSGVLERAWATSPPPLLRRSC